MENNRSDESFPTSDRDVGPSDSPAVACSVCQHEIPLSAAISREASDYVEYYCGLECFQRWRDRAAVNWRSGLAED